MSLGLVSYDDSDESDNDVDSDNVNDAKIFEQGVKQSGALSSSISTTRLQTDLIESLSDDEEPTTRTTNSEQTSNLHLPESKISLINTDIDIKFLTSSNRKNGPVKITIPSLNEVLDDSEEPTKKKIKPSQKGSGLFALLPNPKSALVPQSVVNRNAKIPAKRPNSTAISKKSIHQSRAVSVSSGINPVKSSLINYEDSGDEDESSGSVDFFSLDSKEDNVTAAPVNIDLELPLVNESTEPQARREDTSDTPLSFTSSFQPQKWPEAPASQPSNSFVTSEYPTNELMTFSSTDLELDQEAMQQLCGRRDRLKMGEVNLIDVSGDAIMPDSREWLTKQLTEEQAHRPSHKKKDGPTSQQKRKHQITYLAYQAKENELELKNQWANNRMSRKQTQAKYGF